MQDEFESALNSKQPLAARREHIPKKLSTFDLLFATLKNRGSVRKFQKKDVPQQILEKILLAATFAPSAGNFQPWEFIVIKNSEIKKSLAGACYDQPWLADAPVIIAVCINMRLAGSLFGERGEKLYGIQDTAAAAENMLIAATSLGLGSCWVGAFSEPGITVLLEVPQYVRPTALIALGFPAEEPPALRRQALADVVHFEKFGETPRTIQSGVRADGGTKIALTNVVNRADEKLERGWDIVKEKFEEKFSKDEIEKPRVVREF